MIIAATGHRTSKLTGYKANVEDSLYKVALDYLRREHPERVISGMALGWDTAVARAALYLKLPLTAAVPCDGQEALWSDKDKSRYYGLIALADNIITVNPGPYAAWKMHARNNWMVNNADKVVALWSGDDFGGTFKTIKYAVSKGKPVDNLWNEWAKLQK